MFLQPLSAHVLGSCDWKCNFFNGFLNTLVHRYRYLTLSIVCIVIPILYQYWRYIAELILNCIWTAPALHLNCSWTAPELLLNCYWTVLELNLKYSWLLLNCSWTAPELNLNCSWTAPDLYITFSIFLNYDTDRRTNGTTVWFFSSCWRVFYLIPNFCSNLLVFGNSLNFTFRNHL